MQKAVELGEQVNHRSLKIYKENLKKHSLRCLRVNFKIRHNA